MKIPTIAELWAQYILMAALDDKVMQPVKLQETRRAFYGGCGMIMMLYEQHIGALATADIDAVNEALKKIQSELATFWLGEAIPK